MCKTTSYIVRSIMENSVEKALELRGEVRNLKNISMRPLRKLLKCKTISFCKFYIFFICLIQRHLLHKIKYKIYQNMQFFKFNTSRSGLNNKVLKLEKLQN